MVFIPKQPKAESVEQFAEAANNWNLEKLYADLQFAKQRQNLNQRKQLTPVEKACLRGLLCGYSPAEIAAMLGREPRGLRVDLSKGLYRYIETLTSYQLKGWRHVSDSLERAGYKTHLLG